MIRNEARTTIDPHAATVPPASGEMTAAEFAPGRVVAGKYAVEHAIGNGGLAVVLKARHQQLDQHVAIKHLKPFAAARPSVVERFLREARLAAKIKNEHSVRVHDVDATESGVPYMVMEYLEGRDLDRVVAELPLRAHVAIDYVMQAIEAIAEAHAAGIVHRDLKPANLFLASRPGGTSSVKVLDFGISKATFGDSVPDKRVTGFDECLGTPAFMSPEQLEAAHDIDARSDVWSLGVVLYELVTGKLPFVGPELPQLCLAILQKPPVPLSAVHADAPPELEQVIERCLQKDRAQRYQNVAELAQDLAQIFGGEAPSRVRHISAVIAEAGHSIAQPAPSTLGEMPPARHVDEADPYACTQSVVVVDEDHVIAVFADASGAQVDQLEFLSVDEAYDYASSLGPQVVRCELHDRRAGVRGKARATYVRKPDSEHWVPVIQ